MEDLDPAGRIQHYQDRSQVPPETLKYYSQRHQLFSKYDQGIHLTNEAWYEITPEPIANKIALHLASITPASKTVLIDCFAGAGGNTIAFALSNRWQRIFAIEKDAEALKCAKHNAEIYGVAKKIWWIEGDSFEVLRKRLKSMGREAVVFASPPWGGQSYRDSAVFDLEGMQPYGLTQLYEAYSRFASHFVLYLPRQSDLNQVVACMRRDERQMGILKGGEGESEDEGVEKRAQVMHYCMLGASKALCVFVGDFGEIPEE